LTQVQFQTSHTTSMISLLHVSSSTSDSLRTFSISMEAIPLCF
jgi:hypothetical protein